MLITAIIQTQFSIEKYWLTFQKLYFVISGLYLSSDFIHFELKMYSLVITGLMLY